MPLFTGIVQQLAKVSALVRRGAASALELDLGPLSAEVAVGDSVLADGICLTATALKGAVISFDVSAETLRLTTLGALRAGGSVNIELAMRPTDRFGGHFVSGHIDGAGVIARKDALPGEVRLAVNVPSNLSDMMIMKGSVAVDGISLTIAALRDGAFEVSIIPHTLAATTLAHKKPGARVNVECDMVGKWIRKYVAEASGQPGRLTLDKLQEEGF